jgi:hypothetical protein
MESYIKQKLKKLDIDPDSEFGKALISLDEVYLKIETLKKNIKLSVTEMQQLEEDAEVMELLLMHKFNKDTRRWESLK